MTAFKTELLLARTFAGRFFESDLMPPGFPQVQIVIWGIAVLAAPGYLMSMIYALRYGGVPRHRLVEATLMGELLFVMLGMIALGAVALVIWEGVFPDRRDVRILGVLPLRTRTHVIARVGALTTVAGLFCIGVNLPSAVVYGLTLWGNDVGAGPLRTVTGHLIATAMGGFFVFFLVIAAQGVLLILFGRRIAQKLAMVLQVGCVVVLLQALLFFPSVGSVVRAAFHGDDRTLMAFLPIAWFLALYELLAGAPRPVFVTYALVAVGATAGAMLIATTLIAGSYRRLVRMALETSDGSTRTRAGFLSRLSAVIARRVPRHPVHRAVTGFTLRTLTRSRTHLTLLATYVGIAAALVLAGLVPVISRGGLSAVQAPNIAVLSGPLIFNFFVLCGMRVLFGIPTEIKANWAFRLRASDDSLPSAIAGVRTALLLAGVLPIAVAAGFVGVTLWGVRRGVVHGLFTGALGVLLADVVLFGFRKIPFTSIYYPGRSRARTLWPAYAFAFSMYAYSLAQLQLEILDEPLSLAIAFAVMAVLAIVLARLRRQALKPPAAFSFAEDDPDVPFGGFSLSEGLAAESPATDRRRRDLTASREN